MARSKLPAPRDFVEKEPDHFLELDPLLYETLDDFVDRHVLMLRYAYAVSDGEINPAMTLSDGQVERVYAARDEETSVEYLDRMLGLAKNHNRIFFQRIIPAVVTKQGEAKVNERTLVWYAAESTGEHGYRERVGSMGLIDNEKNGTYALGQNRMADPETFEGWLADRLRNFLPSANK